MKNIFIILLLLVVNACGPTTFKNSNLPENYLRTQEKPLQDADSIKIAHDLNSKKTILVGEYYNIENILTYRVNKKYDSAIGNTCLLIAKNGNISSDYLFCKDDKWQQKKML